MFQHFVSRWLCQNSRNPPYFGEDSKYNFLEISMDHRDYDIPPTNIDVICLNKAMNMPQHLNL